MYRADEAFYSQFNRNSTQNYAIGRCSTFLPTLSRHLALSSVDLGKNNVPAMRSNSESVPYFFFIYQVYFWHSFTLTLHWLKFDWVSMTRFCFNLAMGDTSLFRNTPDLPLSLPCGVSLVSYETLVNFEFILIGPGPVGELPPPGGICHNVFS